MAQPYWKIKKFAPKVTKAEKRFFFTGLKEAKIAFMTQFVVRGTSGKPYRVDGLVSPNVVVEIDGKTHEDWMQKVKDERRDADLKNAGYIVIRFSNWEVFHELANCIKVVIALLPESFRPDDRNREAA